MYLSHNPLDSPPTYFISNTAAAAAAEADAIKRLKTLIYSCSTSVGKCSSLYVSQWHYTWAYQVKYTFLSKHLCVFILKQTVFDITGVLVFRIMQQ